MSSHSHGHGRSGRRDDLAGGRWRGRLLCGALLLAGGCGAAERDRLQREVSGLRYDLVQARQHNADLKHRMRLTETRDRVLVNLVRGLTADPNAAASSAADPGVAHASLAAIDRDLDDLAETIHQSRTDLSALRHERAALQRQLQQALDAIEQTRAIERAAQERLVALRDALMRFTSADAAAMELTIVDNRLLLKLPDSMLFDRGAAAIKRAGKPALNALASALLEVSDLELQVVGHAALGSADRGGFESAWQLSAARAAHVAAYLAARGVDARRLSAIAHADLAPIEFEPGSERQRLNRRVELVLRARPPEAADNPPRSSDAVPVPATQPTPAAPPSADAPGSAPPAGAAQPSDAAVDRAR